MLLQFKVDIDKRINQTLKQGNRMNRSCKKKKETLHHHQAIMSRALVQILVCIKYYKTHKSENYNFSILYITTHFDERY